MFDMKSRGPVICQLLFFASFVVENGQSLQKNRTLTVGGFYASGEKTTFQNASGILEIVKRAVRDINRHPNLLRGYEIDVQWQDTKCQLGHGVQALFKHVRKPPTRIMLLGGICSEATRPIAECSQLANLVQVSYGATTPYLSDREAYPLFFRSVPPEDNHNQARLAVLRYFGWSRLAMLTEREEYFQATFNSLVNVLEANNITIVAKGHVVEDRKDQKETIDNLKENDARIIIAFVSEIKAVEIFCEAYKQGMYGRKYVWFLVGWYQPKWWLLHEHHESSVGCQPGDIHTAFGNYIAIDYMSFGHKTQGVLIDKETYKTWKDNIQRYGSYSGFAYDAMLAISLALNSSIEVLAARNKSLHEFTYEDHEMAQVFKKAMFNVSFKGLTGRVYFNKNGSREGELEIQQLQGPDMVLVGNHSEETLHLNSSRFTWGGAQIPSDRMTVKDKLQTIPIGSFSVFCALQIAGILMATAFLVFNIIYADHRFVRMSSPRMNNVIVTGCILSYSAGILNGIDGNFVGPSVEALLRCRVSLWLACFGFTLGYGAMFFKTWRVYRIFLNKQKRTVISDMQLFVMLVPFVLVDLVILVVWGLVDPMNMKINYTGKDEYIESEDVKYQPFYRTCSSHNTTIWSVIMYAFKGLMLAFGAFLAWETRTVDISALNDSRYIGISVYNVVLSCAMGITIISTIEFNPDVQFVVISLLVLFCTTITLCLVFIPKIITVKRDPEGNERVVCVPALNTESRTNQWLHTVTQSIDNERLKQKPALRDRTKSSVV